MRCHEHKPAAFRRYRNLAPGRGRTLRWVALVLALGLLGTYPPVAAQDPTTSAKLCQTDADCDDGLPCTVDICQKGNCTWSANDKVCDDDLFCNGAEVCDLNVGCKPGPRVCPVGQDCEENEAVCTDPSAGIVAELDTLWQDLFEQPYLPGQSYLLLTAVPGEETLGTWNTTAYQGLSEVGRGRFEEPMYSRFALTQIEPPIGSQAPDASLGVSGVVGTLLGSTGLEVPVGAILFERHLAGAPATRTWLLLPVKIYPSLLEALGDVAEAREVQRRLFFEDGAFWDQIQEQAATKSFLGPGPFDPSAPGDPEECADELGVCLRGALIDLVVDSVSCGAGIASAALQCLTPIEPTDFGSCLLNLISLGSCLYNFPPSEYREEVFECTNEFFDCRCSRFNICRENYDIRGIATDLAPGETADLKVDCTQANGSPPIFARQTFSYSEPDQYLLTCPVGSAFLVRPVEVDAAGNPGHHVRGPNGESRPCIPSSNPQNGFGPLNEDYLAIFDCECTDGALCPRFNLSGTATGLPESGGVEVQVKVSLFGNGSSFSAVTTSVNSNGSFTFEAPVPRSAYDVSIINASEVPQCTVERVAETIDGEPGSTIQVARVDCADENHEVKVQVAGLMSGSVRVRLTATLPNGSQPDIPVLSVLANKTESYGSFPTGTELELQVLSWPGGLEEPTECTLEDYPSTIANEAVLATVTCETELLNPTVERCAHFPSMCVNHDDDPLFLVCSQQWSSQAGSYTVTTGDGCTPDPQGPDGYTCATYVSDTYPTEVVRIVTNCWIGPCLGAFCGTAPQSWTAAVTPFQTVALGEGPWISIYSPQDGAVVSGHVHIVGMVMDADEGISELYFAVDDQPVDVGGLRTDLSEPSICEEWDVAAHGPCDPASQFSGYLDTTQLSDGPHVLEIIAVDHSQPYPLTSNFTTTIVVNNAGQGADPCDSDSVPPSVAIQPPGPVLTQPGPMTVAVSATDANGISRVDLVVDGLLFATDTAVPYTFSWPATLGTHTLVARARDTCGNSGSSNPLIVLVEEPVGPAFALHQGATNVIHGSSVIDFGTLASGQVAVRAFEVVNNGDENLVMNSGAWTLEGSEFELLGPLPVLVPKNGGTASFTIRATGFGDPGTVARWVDLVHGGANVASPFRFKVQRTLEFPEPSLEVLNGTSPVLPNGTVAFGNVPTGETRDLALTLVNHGDAVLSLDPSTWTIAGNEFAFTGSLPTQVSAHSDTASLGLRATGLGAAGGLARWVTLHHSATNIASPLRFKAHRNLVDSEPSLEVFHGASPVLPNSVVFFGEVLPGQTLGRQLTLVNHGDADLSLDPATFSIPGTEFTFAGSLPNLVPKNGGSATLVIRATGDGDPGPQARWVDLPHTASNVASPLRFKVHRDLIAGEPSLRIFNGATEIVQGSIFFFGDVDPGQVVGRQFIIVNHGDADLNLDPSSWSIPGTEFVFAGTLPTFVAKNGGSATFVIRATGAGDPGPQARWVDLPHPASNVSSPLRFKVHRNLTP